MPLLRNNHQPYFPDPNSPNNYNCGDEAYCNPIALGDQIMTQFYQTPCGTNEIEDPTFSDYTLGSELLTNGTFTGSAAGWTLGTDWAYGTNNVEHTPGATDSISQGTLGMTLGNLYQITIEIIRTAGSVYVQLGDGAGANLSQEFDQTGTYTVQLYWLDVPGVDDILQVFPSDDFDGSVESVSLKEVTMTSWEPNSEWVFSDGAACHQIDGTGALEQTVANYITSGGYYKIYVTASGVTEGSCEVYVSDSLVGTITENGDFTYWTSTRPTVTGVVSFVPTTTFDGCISGVDLRELRDDYSGDLINTAGDTYDLSPYFYYYEDYVTLAFYISVFEVPYGCYTISVYDACLIEGNDLVTNGDFATGDYTGWIRNNEAQQFNINGSNQLEFIFDPMTGETDLVTDGDFASGAFAPNWTAGANWSVVGNKARHTAGSTDTFYQTIVIAAPPAPPFSEQYWVQFTISNWTTGTIRATWGNQSSPGFGENNTITYPLTPGVSGSVDLIFTPSSTFDGDVDDIVLIASNTIWSASPFMTNVVNTDMVAGNYDASLEIISSTNSLISAAVSLVNQTQSITYYTSVGVHTTSITNYTPGAQQVRIQGRFRDGFNFIPGTMIVDNITAVRVEPFDATYTSECLNYQLSHNFTKMMVGYCDQPAFGFEFDNTGFRLQQRAVIRSIAPNYPKEKQIMKSGNGDARVVYSGVEKYWQLHTTMASETFHDALSVMIDCDHFLIGDAQDNGIEYIAEAEDYSPQWLQDGSYSLAPAIINLRIKEKGQLFNRHI